MEILILLAGLITLDILAYAAGPDSDDLERALHIERTPVRPDAFLTARPEPTQYI
jgi:hypothetical protein